MRSIRLRPSTATWAAMAIVLRAGDQTYDLRSYERVFVVGAGKAGAPMARAAAEVVGDRLAGGVVVVKG